MNSVTLHYYNHQGTARAQTSCSSLAQWSWAARWSTSRARRAHLSKKARVHWLPDGVRTNRFLWKGHTSSTCCNSSSWVRTVCHSLPQFATSSHESWRRRIGALLWWRHLSSPRPEAVKTSGRAGLLGEGHALAVHARLDRAGHLQQGRLRKTRELLQRRLRTLPSALKHRKPLKSSLQARNVEMNNPASMSMCVMLTASLNRKRGRRDSAREKLSNKHETTPSYDNISATHTHTHTAITQNQQLWTLRAPHIPWSGSHSCEEVKSPQRNRQVPRKSDPTGVGLWAAGL